MKESQTQRVIVIGCSSGGLAALSNLLMPLPKNYPFPILVVQHRLRGEKGLLEEVLQAKIALKIKQADEKEMIKGSYVYIAPPDYHLLLEHDMTTSLSSDPLVRFSRPSIDVLFESAADACREKLVGILMTGANNDGALGITAIKKCGGITIAQEPRSAESPYMPQSAINTGHVQHILTIAQITSFLLLLNGKR